MLGTSVTHSGLHQRVPQPEGEPGVSRSQGCHRRLPPLVPPLAFGPWGFLWGPRGLFLAVTAMAAPPEATSLEQDCPVSVADFFGWTSPHRCTVPGNRGFRVQPRALGREQAQGARRRDPVPSGFRPGPAHQVSTCVMSSCGRGPGPSDSHRDLCPLDMNCCLLLVT